jgi:aminopeptidase N
MSENSLLCLVKSLLCLLVLLLVTAVAHAASDVLDYSATLEPDIANKSVKGSVLIRVLTDSQEVVFDCGDLIVDSVTENGKPLRFSVSEHKLRVSLAGGQGGRKSRTELQIQYHGTPRRGIRFFPDRQQVYTIYATSQWMVCNDEPRDKATFTLKLILPASLTVVANGELTSQREVSSAEPKNQKRISEWRQRSPIPTYIFGFAAGPFKVVKEKHKNVELQYLATNYSEPEVRRIFSATPDMLDFFESRAGVKYADKTYTQVLAAGGVEQEMSSFTGLRESYGKDLLNNDQDVWLAAHEFAHQWWGNMVTCRDWNHFWLNEGVATFMAAAYIEHRFGRAAYLREIESYHANYEKVRAAGKDKPLIFPDWLHPTSEDRTLVYDKGAYVLHLLREEMGERAFWRGLQIFTERHFGKSVVTSDFMSAMEEANGKSLHEFFAKWVI